MKTEALDIRSLEQLLDRHTGSSGHDGPKDETEHPLAHELRTILTDPSAHRIGDLAKVVDGILREMTMLAPAVPGDAEQDEDTSKPA